MSALKGLKVLEMAGVAPVPLCGMFLGDFGANVIRIDRTAAAVFDIDRLARGKRSIALNLKDEKGQKIVQDLAASSDVIIEPFRTGVMEKLNLGPDKLLAKNPGLIYARLTGFGQTGPFAKKSGHDINFIATSGILSIIGRKDEKPYAPVNIVAGFAGGSLACAFGILLALMEKQKSGKGQVVDLSMAEGAAYVSAFYFCTRDLPIWSNVRGKNWLDGGAHFYDTYKTKDNKYIALGSLEPQFYQNLLKGLGLDSIEQVPNNDEGKEKFTKKFAQKTQAEWMQIFDKLDACVTPVIEMDEAGAQEPNVSRKNFVKNSTTGNWDPEPSPKLSRTPGVGTSAARKCPEVGEHTEQILKEIGYDSDTIKSLISSKTIKTAKK